jgi:outer membrane protein assembly factor BamB
MITRRGFLIAGLAAAATPAALRARQADEWRQFRGSPQLIGVAPTAPPATLKVLWTHDAGDIIESSAAIAGGVVYVGAGNGDLLALDLASGKLRWKYTTGDLLGESSPAVDGGTVFIGDLAGTAHAVNAADGKRLWTFKAGGEIKSSPVVVNGLVLMGSYDTHLFGLDPRTGAVRWKFQTQGPVHATPAVLGDVCFIAGCDATFRAIRIADGKQAYEIPIGAYTGASPVVANGHAYFGTFENDVVALDLKGRKVVWRFSDPTRQFPFYSSGALSAGRLVIGGRDKLVRAFDPASGKQIWEFATRARVDSSPVIAGDRVFVGSSDNRFYVLNLQSGKKAWEFDTGGAVTSSAAIAGGRIVIGSQNGTIYCLG